MPDAPELEITRAMNRVTIVGDIRTPADRELLKDQILEAPTDTDVILDVSRAGYCDTTCLATIVSIARRLSEIGSRLCLEGASPDLAEQLRVTHIDEVLTIIATRAKTTEAA